MAVGKLMKSGGWAALAVALAASAVPDDAWARPDDESEQSHGRAERTSRAGDGGRPSSRVETRVRNTERSNQQRTERTEQRPQVAERQVRQVDRRSEQRTAQVGQQGDRVARQTARPGNWQGDHQADRTPAKATRQIEQRGGQTVRPIEQRAARNQSYTDQNRNRAYVTASSGNRAGNGWQGERRNHENDNWRGERRDDNRRDNGNRAYGNGHDRSWDRNWRNNNRYDWHRYRDGHRQVYRIGAYYAPYRYYTYRRFGVGSYLNSLFFGSSYWIASPWQYRLPEVWGPYRWVRYYDDVLLVNIYTGEVADVIYNFFW